MKLRLILFLCLIGGQLSKAQDPLEISIITCAPGPEIYSVFGHSAIHIVNHDTGLDQIFDFGTFDFDTPNFGYRFLKGRLKYHLSIRNTERFIFAYTYENRLLTEQKLNLPFAQKEQIIQRLLELYRPENRYYYYSFLNKDCSTDLRDLLEHVGVEFSDEMLGKTKREQIAEYMTDTPWLGLGVNLILGRQLDVESSRYESTFLPDYLKTEIDEAVYLDQPIVGSEILLNEVVEGPRAGIFKTLSPLVVFIALLLISIFWFPKGLKLLWSLVIGLGGLLILIVWLFSDHPEVKNNLNLLWCNPLYLLYIPLFIRNRSHKLLSQVLIGFTLLAGILWLFGVQSFDMAVLPLLALLTWLNFKELRKRPEATSVHLAEA